MFAEPAVTDIEEVVCLIHGEKKKAKGKRQKAEYRRQHLRRKVFCILSPGFFSLLGAPEGSAR
jgi:hypothetical protein